MDFELFTTRSNMIQGQKQMIEKANEILFPN